MADPGKRKRKRQTPLAPTAARAERRMLAGGESGHLGGRGNRQTPRLNSDEGFAGRRTDAGVAEAIGMKKSTYRKVTEMVGVAPGGVR